VKIFLNLLIIFLQFVILAREAEAQIRRQHGIPAMVDIAADVLPVENLWKFNFRQALPATQVWF
jgi:hypothetical protein